MDHIVPKNQGGSDDLSNLQALCFRCNAGKRDTDSTDFRGLQASYALREAGCVSACWRAAAGCCWKTSWRCASPMPTR